MNHVTYHCYLAQFEPKKVEEVLKDKNWVESMHQELHQLLEMMYGNWFQGPKACM